MDELGTEVYALSLDDVADLAKFAEAQELDYRLLSDPDGSAARKYGVLNEKRGYAQRVTFILDDKGVLRHIDREVNVRAHGNDIAEKIKELQKE